MSKAQEQADIQRAEAKRLLQAAFGFSGDTTNKDIDRTVDCIIGAALLEMVSMYETVSLEKKEGEL